MATRTMRTSSLVGQGNLFKLMIEFSEGAGEGARGYVPRDDEAMEDDDAILDDDQAADGSDEGEGEDLLENMEDDYQPKAELDRYESEGLDDEGDHADLDYQQRRELEKQMDQEARAKAQRGRRAGAFMDDDEYSEADDVARQMRLERMRQQNQRDEDVGAAGEDHEMVQDVIDYEEVKGPLSQWIQRPEVVRWIRKSFSNFLRSFKEEQTGVSVYEERIREMCSNNKQSLEVTFIHLSVRYPFLAIWLAEEPMLMLPILNEVALEVTIELFPDYHAIHHTIYARIRDMPIEDKLRDLRQIHLNSLIKIRGVVTKRTGVFPEYNKIFYRCQCGDIKGPIFHNNPFEGKQFLGQCVVCQSNGPFTVDEVNTVYRNYQKMTIQETPGTVPPGRVPRQKEVYVLNDQVDSARPGDEVEITGVYINRFDYFSNVKHGFPVFTTIIEANYIRRFGDEDIIELTEEDK
jgi:DNA replication licensing factor MCM2